MEVIEMPGPVEAPQFIKKIENILEEYITESKNVMAIDKKTENESEMS